MSIRDMAAAGIHGIGSTFYDVGASIASFGQGVVSTTSNFVKPVVLPVLNFAQPVTQPIANKICAVWGFATSNAGAFFTFATTPLGTLLIGIAITVILAKAVNRTHRSESKIVLLLALWVSAVFFSYNFMQGASQAGWLPQVTYTYIPAKVGIFA